MTERITVDLTDTDKMVGEILLHTMDGKRVCFLVPAGASYHTCARIRTLISRMRKRLEQNGKRPKRFTLRSSTHSETHGGIRQDCIVMWQETAEHHLMTEKLEDLLAQ